jgi:hypothetical protein
VPLQVALRVLHEDADGVELHHAIALRPAEQRTRRAVGGLLAFEEGEDERWIAGHAVPPVRIPRGASMLACMSRVTIPFA